MEVQVIVWTFIVLFAITAIITLLGITGVIKSIKERYLNILFTSLILEVVAAVVMVFNSSGLVQASASYAGLLQEAKIEDSFEAEEDRKFFIVERLKMSQEIVRLEALIAEKEAQKIQLEKDLAVCQEDMEDIHASFYTKITKLRNAITRFGGSININYKVDEKKEVLALMEEILAVLGYLDGNDPVTTKQVLNNFVDFKRNHGRHKDNKYIISEYDTTLMVREYLNKYYPIQPG